MYVNWNCAKSDDVTLAVFVLCVNKCVNFVELVEEFVLYVSIAKDQDLLWDLHINSKIFSGTGNSWIWRSLASGEFSLKIYSF